MANLKLPVAQGTKAAYAAITTKDANKIYILKDAAESENNIFLGTIPLGKSAGKVLKDVAFNNTTHAFTFTYTDNTTQVIDLVLESVIQDISYNSGTRKLTFTLVGGSTTDIDLTDLVDAYEGGGTDSAAVDVAAGVITVDVEISNTPGNALSVEAGKGLFVNISTKMDKVSGAVENNIATFATNGQVKDSGKGIATEITDAATDNKLATEKAVADALQIGTF
jgi:hypothetical protein